jgi:uncharacterized protein YdeI (YjbR/CyaY-like superfamily)
VTREPRIDQYIAAAAPFAQPILSHLRERIHATVPDIDEAIKWSMPAFTRGGAIVAMMAAFKAHATLSFWRGGEIADGKARPGAMGQFGRLTSLADLPPDTELDGMIAQAAALALVPPAPRKPKAAPPREPAPHPDFTAALAADPALRNRFEAMSPSHRREYLAWIGEAKRDETRARRIAKAVAQIAEGKSQNWKYERR